MDNTEYVESAIDDFKLEVIDAGNSSVDVVEDNGDFGVAEFLREFSIN